MYFQTGPRFTINISAILTTTPDSLRRFQSLRHFEEAPQLPNGYFGMFPIAYLPPLWFYVMDKRLLAAVDRDPARINFAPHMRDRLMARHRLVSRSNVAL